MKLENIGFYTLEDARAKNLSLKSPLWRCELILTDACNFRCPYCRGLEKNIKGKIPLEKAKRIVKLWASDGLQNIRFFLDFLINIPYLTIREAVRDIY